MRGITISAALTAAMSCLLFASQSVNALEQPPAECLRDPATGQCVVVEVKAKSGGVGDWPSGMFIDLGGGYPVIHETNWFGGDYFDSNDGQDTVDAKEDCGLGNPVIPSSGNKIEPETDFVSAGEVPLFLKRTYNRYWSEKGIFGYNWVSNFDLKITKTADGQVIWAYRSNARKVAYTYRTTPVAGWYETKAEAVSKIVADGAGGYILYGEDDSIETYDATGQITSLKNVHGIGITFTYSNSRLYRATHTSGRYVQFGWTGDYVTSVIDPAGNAYGYGYAPSHVSNSFLWLASTVQPGSPGTTITYHYTTTDSQTGQLAGKSYNGVRYSTFAYNSYGRAISSEHSGGVDKHTFVYTTGVAGSTTTVHTNPLGKTTTYGYQDGKLVSTTGHPSTYCPNTVYSEITYDANGYEDLVTDYADNITDFDYNPKGQLLKVTEAASTAFARVTDYLWDSVKNRIVRETVVGLRQTDYVYLANGRISSITVTNRSSQGVPGQVRATGYGYSTHPNGMLSATVVDGPLPGSGDAITTAYDSVGNLISVRNSLGHVISYSGHNGLGLPSRVTGINGGIVDYTYDARGRVLTSTSYINTTAYTTTNVYDDRGRLIKMTSPDGVVLSYVYDSNNRLVKVTRPETNSAYASLGSDLIAFQRFTYNLNADVIQTETGVDYVPTTAATAPTTASTSGGGLEAQACSPQPDCVPDPDPTPTRSELVTSRSFTDYDELGRVRARRGNNAQNIRYGYDDNGNVKTVTDSLGMVTTLSYDVLGRVITSTDAKGGITRFEYDQGDRLTKATDPRGVITSYVHDGFGQLWAQSSADTGTTNVTYDAYGRRTTMTRANTQQTTYGYDALGRPTTVTAAGQTQTFAYDTCSNGKGLLCTVTDPTGSVSYTYTPRGQRVSQTSVLPNSGPNGAPATHTYAYDGMDRLTGIGYPGAGVGYGYAGGKLTTVTATVAGVTTNVASGIDYEPSGAISGWAYGNGLTRGYNHDLDGRLTGVSTGTATGVLQSLTYAHNANDAITRITNGVNASLTQTYGYDALSRLTAVTATNADQAFTYDPVGNRSSHTWGGLTDNYTSATTSNRLLSISGGQTRSFAYNANGNVVSGGGTSNYAYDGFERMVAATKNGVTTDYAVNALGQRVYKKMGGTHFWFSYAPGGTLLGEYRTGVGWTHYVRIGGEPIAILRPGPGQLYYVHGDHLGRPELVTTPAQTPVWRASNFAFDRTVTLDSISGLNIGLPGQYYDAEIGHWNNGFRDYDPRWGRYIQSDPIGLAGGLNTYAYVGGNPISYVDPHGKSVVRALGLAIGCGSAAWGGYQATIVKRQLDDDFNRKQKKKDGKNCPADEGANANREELARRVSNVSGNLQAYGPAATKVIVGAAIATMSGSFGGTFMAGGCTLFGIRVGQEKAEDFP